MLLLQFQWSWETIVMGVGFLSILLTTRHIVSVLTKISKHFQTAINRNRVYNISCCFFEYIEHEEAKTFLDISCITFGISYYINTACIPH